MFTAAFAFFPAVTCSNPPDIRNGVIQGHVYTYGGVVNYFCHSGYCLNGNSSSRCLEDGHWSHQDASCERKLPQIQYIRTNFDFQFLGLLCPYPPSLLNGSRTVSSRDFGAVVTYECLAGFVLVGSRIRSCIRHPTEQCSLKWSGSELECRGVKLFAQVRKLERQLLVVFPYSKRLWITGIDGARIGSHTSW